VCTWLLCECIVNSVSHQLCNKTSLLQTDILDEDKRLVSAVDYYFIQEDGSRFKVRKIRHGIKILTNRPVMLYLFKVLLYY